MKYSPRSPNPADANALKLHPDDLNDLRRSGLSDSMIAAMDCFSVEPEEIQSLTGVKAPYPGYAIPYHGVEDQTGDRYCRIRLRGPVGDMRYVSGRGEDTQVYDPPGRADLPAEILVITEGEKKAAKAVQEGIACIGIQGVHSWCDAAGRAVEKAAEIPVNAKTAPTPGLLGIAKGYKKVLVLGDSDLLGNPQGRRGMELLVKSLGHNGIRCVVGYCPPAIIFDEGEPRVVKQGIDDWLLKDRFTAAESIPALYFASEVAENEITDSDNAQSIADLFGRELAYSRGVWYRWEKPIWRIDDCGARRKLASKVAGHYRAHAERLRELARKVAGPYGSREESYPDILENWVAPTRIAIKYASAAATKIENLHHMEAAFTIAQAHLSVPSDAWDRDAHLLAVSNGVIDLCSGALQEPTPELKMTRMAGAAYDPHAHAPSFHAFLDRVQPDPAMRDYLQRLAGYSAMGHAREQKFFTFLGGGANGKGTFMGAIMAALGAYAVKATPGLLAEQPPGKPRNDVAALAGARLVSFSETSANLRIDEALIKAMTGQDLMTARFLYGEFFTFQPCCTPILDTNHAPSPRDPGEGIWRRFEIVPWEVMIPAEQRDEELRERLLGELPGILKWIIDGARKYDESGLSNVSRIRDETCSLRESCDLVGRWVEACVARDLNGRARSSDLYRHFSRWVIAQGEKDIMSNKAFAKELKRKGFENRKSNGLSVWLGVRIRDDLGLASTDMELDARLTAPSINSMPITSSEQVRSRLVDHPDHERRMTPAGNHIV